jgi:hypothetical protein
MHETVRDTSYHLYRNSTLIRVRATTLWVLGGLILTWIAVFATRFPHQSTASRRDTVDITLAVLAAIGLILIWLGLRVARSGIMAGPRELSIRRVLRPRTRLPWAEVVGFDIVRARRFDNQFTRSAVAIAVLRNARKPLYCIGASFAEPQPAADQMITALRNDQAAALPNSAVTLLPGADNSLTIKLLTTAELEANDGD